MHKFIFTKTLIHLPKPYGEIKWKVIKSGWKNVSSWSMFTAKLMPVIFFLQLPIKTQNVDIFAKLVKSWQSYRSSRESFPKILKVTKAWHENFHVPLWLNIRKSTWKVQSLITYINKEMGWYLYMDWVINLQIFSFIPAVPGFTHWKLKSVHALR